MVEAAEHADLLREAGASTVALSISKSMGSGASLTLQNELDKPLDASDVHTPRGMSAVAEVARLRTLLLAQQAEQAGHVL